MAIHSDIVHDILIHCDRTRSKEARFALERLLWKPLRSQNIELLSDCPLSWENDILRAQESQKHHMHDDLWQCSLCRKVFRSEHYLDKHLARKHPGVRHETGTSCFAELCGVLVPCMPLAPRALAPVSTVLTISQDRGEHIVHEPFTRPFCTNRSLRRTRVRACEEVIRHCLPHSGSVISGFSAHGMLLYQLREDLCERAVEVECVARDDVWSRFGPPERMLRPRRNGSVIRYLGWIFIVLLLAFTTLWRRSQKMNAETRTLDRRRRRRKPAQRTI